MGKVICLHQTLCLLVLFFHFHVISSSSSLSCPLDQSLALLQFRNTFVIKCFRNPPYSKVVSWMEGVDCCSWDGVTCDRLSGHVIGLDVSDSCLHGKVHSNSSLFRLPHLRKLNLANNDFNLSQISPEFGRFTRLKYLDLSKSEFDGLVPYEISLLSKLVSLDLSYNPIRIDQHIFKLFVQNLSEIKFLLLDSVDMSLVVPSSFLNLSSSLISLSLKDARLQGNFPDDVFHLPYLQDLKLSANYDLRVTFPKSNWSSSLRSLDLSWTNAGELPDSIGNLKSLKNLYVYDCKITKSIPASLWNLTQITSMDLSFNNFIGQIPPSLSNFAQLTVLDLSWNNFTGQIPDVFGNFSEITELSLSHNNFSGQLPPSTFNLKQLDDLDFSENKLEGTLPCQVSGLSNLTSLDFNHNLLSGRIPSWLFTLPSLQFLDLTNNKLTGPIDQFQQPNALVEVYLGNNEINGSIPSSIFHLLNLRDLDLSSNNLSGIIEPHMLSKLKKLIWLDVSNNRLLSLRGNSSVNYNLPNLETLTISSCNMSKFPNSLRTLENLWKLDLSNNQIGSRISKWELEGWPSLTFLNLSYNFLIGLEQLPNNLITLDLRSNLLEGRLPVPPLSMEIYLVPNNKLSGEIPSSICHLSSVKVLDLSNNSFSGMLPKCLGHFSRELSVLNLRMNNFHGSIPGTFSSGNSLRNFELNGNQLEGPLPLSLVHCSSLEVLDLGNNKINDKFPHWLESLQELQVLILRSNRFHGQIGNSKRRFSLTKLRIIDLSQNEFTGLLPPTFFGNLQAMMDVDEHKVEAEYTGDAHYEDSIIVTMKGLELKLVRILTIFTTIIDLSSNRFEGQIPEVIGKFRSLVVLNFSHNSLTGPIPSSLANIIALESLDLSCNKLVEMIPVQLKSLTFLEVLNLSHNQLVGPIPQGNQFDTFENNSYIGNSRLCGFPLSEKCSNGEAPQLQPSVSHEDEDSGSRFDWNITMMGYGCGLVFGLSMGYIIFSTGKPRWFVRLVEGDQHKKVRKTSQRRQGRRN